MRVSKLPQPVARERLSKWDFAILFLRQQGQCARCSARLERGQTIDEHLQPLDHLGTNELSNRALYCRPCARQKTSKDLAASAKARRLRGEAGQLKRRRERGPSLKSGGKLQSRGFDKRLRKRMDGSVVTR